MSFGFEEPNIHHVKKIDASFRTYYRSNGSRFGCVELKLAGPDDKKSFLRVFVECSEVDYARSIAEAISAVNAKCELVES